MMISFKYLFIFLFLILNCCSFPFSKEEYPVIFTYDPKFNDINELVVSGRIIVDDPFLVNNMGIIFRRELGGMPDTLYLAQEYLTVRNDGSYLLNKTLEITATLTQPIYDLSSQSTSRYQIFIISDDFQVFGAQILLREHLSIPAPPN